MKKTKLDKPLLIVMIVFLVFGLIMVLSASSMASYMRYDKNIYDAIRTTKAVYPDVIKKELVEFAEIFATAHEHALYL